MSEVFVVFPPLANNSIIVGRNSFSFCCKEILLIKPNEGTTKCQNIEVAPITSTFGYILNGTCGSNDKNVSISALFADKKPDNGLTALDLTKLTLERSESAEKAVDVLGELINQYNPDESPETAPRYSFFICDTKEAFVIDIVGRLFAAEQINEGFRAFGKGFAVRTKIDRKSEGLEEKLKEFGLFSGGELDFSKMISSEAVDKTFPSDPETGFSAEKMFEVLRKSAERNDPIASSFVSVLRDNLSLFWFTGTSDPRESVFKPFIFTSEARISPLTKLNDDGDETNLRKLHANRNWEQVGELLKSLEKSCVDEVDGYVDNAPNDELHDLMKDCVEAEVKFYR